MTYPLVLEFDGENFREKIALSVISKKRIKMVNIRNFEKNKGLKNYEVDLLAMIDIFLMGSIIKTNESGTILDFFPGQILKSKIQYNTTSFRSLSYYLEFLIYTTLISIDKIEIGLSGIRSISVDVSLESILYITIPLLRKLGSRDIRFRIFTNIYSSLWNTDIIIFFPKIQIKKEFKITNIGVVDKLRIIDTSSFNNIIKKEEIEEFIGKLSLPRNFNLRIFKIPILNKIFDFQTISLVAETNEGCLFGEDITIFIKKNKNLDFSKILHKAFFSLFYDINTGSSVDKRNHILLFLKILSLGNSNLSIGRLGKLTYLDIKFFRDLKKILGIFFSIKFDVTNKFFIVKLASKN